MRHPRLAKTLRERPRLVEDDSVSVREREDDEEYSIESSGLDNQETNPASGGCSGQVNAVGS